MPKGPRFIIVDHKMTDVEPDSTHPHALWVTDYMWYNEHEPELMTWMEQHQVQMRGMILKFLTEQDRTLFLLRWQ